jgi:hypothetical protein
VIRGDEPIWQLKTGSSSFSLMSTYSPVDPMRREVPEPKSKLFSFSLLIRYTVLFICKREISIGLVTYN